MTVATQSRAQKAVILDAHIETGCATGMLDIAYKLNDFGCVPLAACIARAARAARVALTLMTIAL
jgi:hypothetical protein